MMLQWHACKKSAGDALLLFRLGDFYEAFESDAITIAAELGLTLTKRHETPMCGIPHHTAEGYIDKLVAKGHKVAMAEQTEDPKKAVGIVKREVVRIVTPGTLVASNLLSEKKNNYIATIAQVGAVYGLALLDITTAEFLSVEFEQQSLLFDQLTRAAPAEILAAEKVASSLSLANFKEQCPFTLTTKPLWRFDHKTSLEFLLKHFGIKTVDCFGLAGKSASIIACGVLLAHLSEELALPISHITEIRQIDIAGFLAIDSTAQRHLELVTPLFEGKKSNTLLHHLDKTATPMGARFLKTAILQPLLEKSPILERQEAVSLFYQEKNLLISVQKELEKVRDLERLMMRLKSGYASPRDLTGLRFSLEPLPKLHLLLKSVESLLLSKLAQSLLGGENLAAQIEKAIVDTPPLRLSDGGLIKEGYNAQLDNLRQIKENGQSWIANYQAHLREQLDIKTLKIGYTRAFGYYIEISRGQADKMKGDFDRLQTLVGSERFTSKELKEFEYKILTADEQIGEIEREVFEQIRLNAATYAKTIFECAKAVAEIDFFAALGSVANERAWIKPAIHEGQEWEVIEGRHPVLEVALHSATFIPNDVTFNEAEKLLLITGPNMAGKSTYLRQTALIAILAQMGSFVPAKSAKLCLIDKLFSRIGASDDLSQGKSTFMVEMSETANILLHATDKSLIILDEIGRGTSTYDGISIAWAVAEYLLTTPGKRAKTLFATHYFELTDLAETIPGAVNYTVQVHEERGSIVFMHKIVKGMADKSYGIHVAKIAGLPASAIKCAQARLLEMEKSEKPKIKLGRAREVQLDLFSSREPHPDESLLTEIRECNPDEITPLTALQKIISWKATLS